MLVAFSDNYIRPALLAVVSMPRIPSSIPTLPWSAFVAVQPESSRQQGPDLLFITFEVIATSGGINLDLLTDHQGRAWVRQLKLC